MKNTTLCYIENERGEYLMLHRVKKQNDLNHDKWIGVGGKCEEGESPEECVCRETLECNEGVLEWLHKDALAALPQWEGDKLFLALIHEPDTPFFSMKRQSEGDTRVYAALNGKELAVGSW